MDGNHTPENICRKRPAWMPSRMASPGLIRILRQMRRKSKRSTRKLKVSAHPLSPSTMVLEVAVVVQVAPRGKMKRKQKMRRTLTERRRKT